MKLIDIIKLCFRHKFRYLRTLCLFSKKLPIVGAEENVFSQPVAFAILVGRVSRIFTRFAGKCSSWQRSLF